MQLIRLSPHIVSPTKLCWSDYGAHHTVQLFVALRVIHAINPTRGNPDSQQPTGSQIIKICMGIYRRIDKN